MVVSSRGLNIAYNFKILPSNPLLKNVGYFMHESGSYIMHYGAFIYGNYNLDNYHALLPKPIKALILGSYQNVGCGNVWRSLIKRVGQKFIVDIYWCLEFLVSMLTTLSKQHWYWSVLLCYIVIAQDTKILHDITYDELTSNLVRILKSKCSSQEKQRITHKEFLNVSVIKRACVS